MGHSISRRQLIPIFDKPAFSRFSQLFQPRIVVHNFWKIVKRQVCQKWGDGRRVPRRGTMLIFHLIVNSFYSHELSQALVKHTYLLMQRSHAWLHQDSMNRSWSAQSDVDMTVNLLWSKQHADASVEILVASRVRLEITPLPSPKRRFLKGVRSVCVKGACVRSVRGVRSVRVKGACVPLPRCQSC
jgi:hypothetical protein